jgi:hypothetical protein
MAGFKLQNRMREKSKFANQFNADWAVQPSREKNSASVFRQSVIYLRRPAST